MCSILNVSWSAGSIGISNPAWMALICNMKVQNNWKLGPSINYNYTVKRMTKLPRVVTCTLLCQIPTMRMGKNFLTFLYGNFLLRVLVNAIVWVFAIIIIEISTTALEFTIAVVVNSNNDYSKYPHYNIYQYSQREIPV